MLKVEKKVVCHNFLDISRQMLARHAVVSLILSSRRKVQTSPELNVTPQSESTNLCCSWVIGDGRLYIPNNGPIRCSVSCSPDLTGIGGVSRGGTTLFMTYMRASEEEAAVHRCFGSRRQLVQIPECANRYLLLDRKLIMQDCFLVSANRRNQPLGPD